MALSHILIDFYGKDDELFTTHGLSLIELLCRIEAN